MSVLTLSRIQFAATAMFHFLFVPLTLGLSVLIAWWENRYVRTNDETYLRMARFWGKLFLINFVLGVVTGITMEFQFGMNWAEYSKYVGDIFGAPLAIEATAAFFLESTFVGLWALGWNKVSKRTHARAMAIVAFATNLSALWILLANGWMQRPVGYVLRNGRAEMTDFKALVFNGTGWSIFLHTVLGGFALSAFFVMGVSAYHLIRKREEKLFGASFRTAALFALVASLLVAVTGDRRGVDVATTQPAKLAAMESHWETASGAALPLLAWPDAAHERNALDALRVPKLLSFLSFHSFGAEVKGLKDIPAAERPPVLVSFLSFRIMVLLGVLMILAALGAWLAARRGALPASPRLLRLLLWAIPLPYVAMQLGWLLAEVGRQPWLVYGVLKTADGVTKALAPGQVWLSLVGFVLVYGLLAVVDAILLVRHARKGPEEVA